jgi:hypothetical protein
MDDLETKEPGLTGAGRESWAGGESCKVSPTTDRGPPGRLASVVRWMIEDQGQVIPASAVTKQED